VGLFAGTGAVEIEALSRGAAKVYFVEANKDATELIATNLRSLGIGTGFEILRQDVARALEALKRQTVRPDFIFLDPPYRQRDAYEETLKYLGNSGLNAHALMIAEHEKRFDQGEQVGAVARFRLLRQGDAALSFYRRHEE